MNAITIPLAILTAVALAACESAPTTTTQLHPADNVLASGVPGGHKCASVQVTPDAATIPLFGQTTLVATVLNKKGKHDVRCCRRMVQS